MPAAPFWRVHEEADPTFEVSLLPGQDWISVGPRQALPQSFFAKWNDPSSPVTVSFSFFTESDGEVFCTSLEVELRRTDRKAGIARRDVTLAGIRRIRIAEFKRRAARLAVAEARLENGKWRVVHQALGDSIEAPGLLAGIEKRAHEPQRGKRLSDAHLKKVAAEYRKALSEGKPPTKAVMQKFFTVRPNASRWVAEARKRKLLEPGPTSKRSTKGGKSRGK
jgi:hypothetical protein